MNAASIFRKISFNIATCGPLGFFPKAPGTAGTLLAIPIYLLISPLNLTLQILIIVAFFILAVWGTNEAGRIFGSHDDPRIVIDEVVGYLVTMIAIPPSWFPILLGFLLFRLFDIAKFYPIRLIDTRWRTGVGVVADDVLAGVYAHISLRIIFIFLPTTL